MTRIQRLTASAACTVLGALLATPPASAGCDSGSGYLGSICEVGFSYCPRGHYEADGILLPISQNTALFSLFGTIYGGDGRTTFALPDLRGRKMVHVGNGPGLPGVIDGQKGGAETMTLAAANVPSHAHAATTALTTTLRGSTNTAGNLSSPAGNVLAATRNRPPYPYSSGVADVSMGPSAIATTISTTTASAGGDQAFGIVDPNLGIRHCVTMVGIYPPRG